MFLKSHLWKVFARKCWEIYCQFYVGRLWSVQEMLHLQVYSVAGSFLAVQPCSTKSALYKVKSVIVIIVIKSQSRYDKI